MAAISTSPSSATTAPMSLTYLDPDMMLRMQEAQVRRTRLHLVNRIQSLDNSYQDEAREVVNIDCPLRLKYKYLDVEGLFNDNCQAIDGIAKIRSALGILEKYSKNLLKPKEERPQVWKMIKFGVIIQQRVSVMKGWENILLALGYTQSVSNGVSFPDGVEPNMEVVSNMAADIIILRMELECYQNGTHPGRHRLDEVLPVNARISAQTYVDTTQALPGKNISSPVMRQQIKPPPAGTRSRLSYENMVRPPDKTPVHNEPHSSIGPHSAPEGSPVDRRPAVPKKPLSTGRRSSAPEGAKRPPPEGAGGIIIQNVESEIIDTCDICGQEKAVIRCNSAICDGKVLCQGCDEMWHKHPKRKSHQRQQLVVVPPRSSQQPTSMSPDRGNRPVPMPRKSRSSASPSTDTPRPVPRNRSTNSLSPNTIQSAVGPQSSSAGSIFDILPQVKLIPDPSQQLSTLEDKLKQLENAINDFERKIQSVIASDTHFFERDDYIVWKKQKQKFEIEKGKLLEYRDELKRRVAVANENNDVFVKDDALNVISNQVKHPPGDVYRPGHLDFGGHHDLGRATEEESAYMTMDHYRRQGGDDYESMRHLRPFITKPPPTTNAVIKPSDTLLQKPKIEGPCEMCGKTTKYTLRNCEHCTIELPEAVRVTALRLQDNLEVLPVQRPLEQPAVQRHLDPVLPGLSTETPQRGADGSEGAWNCEHCTFVNTRGSRVCAMCNKTSDNAVLLDSMGVEHAPKNTRPEYSRQEGYEDKSVVREAVNQSDVNGATGTTVPGETPGSASLYLESQDDVFREKQEAWSKYNKETKEDRTIVQGAPPITEQPRAQDPPQSLSHTISRKKMSSTEEMEQVAELNRIENLMYEGQELVRLLRSLDHNNFDLEELTIAQKYCSDKPLEWLKEEWPKRIQEVVVMTTSKGMNMEENKIGEISVEECKIALIKHCGDLEAATKRCLEDRISQYDELNELGIYNPKDITTSLHESKGDIEGATCILNVSVLEPIRDKIWQETCGEFVLLGRDENACTSVVEDEEFLARVNNRDTGLELRVILVLAEGKLQSWGRAETVVKILDMDDLDADLSLEDIIEAVRNCRDLNSSLAYLLQECQLCFCKFPMNKMRSLSFCNCNVCVDCMQGWFEVQIKEKIAKDMTCPVCQQPDIDIQEHAESHFQFLQLMLRTMVDEVTYQLFEKKLRDWHLQKDQNFRWCAHCEEGFLFNPDQDGVIKMACPSCRKYTCFKCKKPWEDQHQDLTCEEFQIWKEMNDPQFQAQGLASHLANNGIDCPNCKFRYALAKGGCMHFKCIQCKHEFCSGCYEPFKRGTACKKYRKCAKAGLHCHHPRNCLFYLRDNPIKDLQKLLQDYSVQFDTLAPENMEGDPTKCCVMEQKETPNGLKDEHCGHDVPDGYAGLCTIHYTEYLVSRINSQNIDPVVISATENLRVIFGRYELDIPNKHKRENDQAYRERLIELLQTKEPLQERTRPGL